MQSQWNYQWNWRIFCGTSCSTLCSGAAGVWLTRSTQSWPAECAEPLRTTSFKTWRGRSDVWHCICFSLSTKTRNHADNKSCQHETVVWELQVKSKTSQSYWPAEIVREHFRKDAVLKQITQSEWSSERLSVVSAAYYLLVGCWAKQHNSFDSSQILPKMHDFGALTSVT